MIGHGSQWAVACPLRMEAAALRSRRVRLPIVHLGMGRARSSAEASQLHRRLPKGAPIAIAGVAGGLDPALRPGSLVVATEVRSALGSVTLEASQALIEALRVHGIAATAAVVATTDHIVTGDRRAQLATTGAVAVDMESAWAIHCFPDRPVCVLRAVADVPEGGLAGVLPAWRIALGALRNAAPALASWQALVTTHGGAS